jgi:D-3-phosphoglycerate dehydrogenase / 2-oxoglutarate reductase
MTARRVLVCPKMLRELDHPALQPLRDAGLEPVAHGLERALSEDELIEALDGVVATIASIEPYNDRVLAARPELRIVARFGVGYDQIDLEAATRHGVAVAMAFGTNHDTVADFAMALLLALGNNLLAQDRHVREGGWGPLDRPGVWGRTVGILGIGRIGLAFALRCRAFRMRLLAFDPVADPARAEAQGIELVGLDQLLRETDFVSIHAPLMPSTRNMIGARELALMKPTAYLINTARGGLVDEQALHAALTDGTIAGAGLDVFEREPPVGSPLIGLDNVVLAPHCAGADAASIRGMAEAAVDNILAIRQGRVPPEGRLLNPEVLAR